MPPLLKINELEKLFAPHRERMAGYNYWIRPDNDPNRAEAEGEVFPASRLLEPDFLKSLLEEWDVTLGSKNLKVAAALWTKYYCQVTYPVVLAAMSLGGLGLDVSLAKTKIVLSRTAGTKPMDGKNCPLRVVFEDSPAVVYAPRCETAELAANALTVESLAELHERVCRVLFVEHFQPLFEAFQVATGVSPKVLWGNLGYGIHTFAAFLGETLGCAAALREDAPVLLETPENAWIAPGKNPLYHPVRHRPLEFLGKPGPAQVRTSCCLWYKVPGAEKCGTCPLSYPVKRTERLEFSLVALSATVAN